MNNTQDKKKPEEIHNLHYYIDHIRYDMTNLIKWLVLAVLTGLSVGFISSLFARVLKFVTNYRTEAFLGILLASCFRSDHCFSVSEIRSGRWRNQSGFINDPFSG